MSDRKLGYILILTILLLSIGAAAYFALLFYAPLERRTLRFPEVGSLAVEDAVRMNGTLVGVVTGFDHDSLGRVLVYVQTPRNFPLFKKSEFPESIPIRTSSGVTVKVKGVMGERFIEISSGDLNDPLIPKEQIVDGRFEMGPSEAIAYMNLLEEKIIELRDLVLWLRDGKDDGRSFIAVFNDVAGTVDTLVFNLLDGLGGMEAGLNAGIDSAARLTEQAITFAADMSTKAPEIIDGLNSIIVKLDDAVTKMDSVFTALDKFAGEVGGNKYLWGDHVERLQKQISGIKKLVDGMRRDGIPLKVKFKFF